MTTRAQPGGLDLLFQPIGKTLLLRHDGADDDACEIGIARQQPAHRLDEHIRTLLRAHPAEAADRVTAGQFRFGKCRRAIGRRCVTIGVDAMHHHGCLALEKRG